MPDYSMAIRAMEEALLALSIVSVTLDGSELECHTGELLGRAMVLYRRCEDAAEGVDNGAGR